MHRLAEISCPDLPTRDAAFIDAACFLIRAMAAGHSASQAEALAGWCPGWQQAPPAAIDVFALANARLFNPIALNDHKPLKLRLAAVAQDWARHRRVFASGQHMKRQGSSNTAAVLSRSARRAPSVDTAR